MKIPFMNLAILDDAERAALLATIDRVLQHGRLINGPEVEEFESSIAKFCGTKYAVGVNSGTSALQLSLAALNIGLGDEVIIPSMSWISTAHAVKLSGATPVFADINDDLNISPESVRKLITSKTKLIIGVHFMGRVCDIDSLRDIASVNNIPIIEDAAQAFGATHKGKAAGSLGLIGCFSLNPMKLLASIGEAGIITTDDSEIANRLKSLRYCGMVDKQRSNVASANFRLETVQAAVLNCRLSNFDSILRRRIEIASLYDSNFTGTNVRFLKRSETGVHAYYGYTILVQDRDKFQAYMQENGVETKIQHAPLMCDQVPYLNHISDKTNASRLAEMIINIPSNEKITDREVHYISKLVIDYYERN